jgi:cytochrome c5
MFPESGKWHECCVTVGRKGLPVTDTTQARCPRRISSPGIRRDESGRMMNWLLPMLLLALVWGGLAPGLGHAENFAEGRRIYVEVCAACHTNGVGGAPRYGYRRDWEKRLSLGKNELLRSVFNGKGAMPPKGGNPSVNDAQAVAATEYMLASVK